MLFEPNYRLAQKSVSQRTLETLLQKNMVSSTVLYLLRTKNIKWDFPGGPVVKNLPAIAGDTGSIPGPRRSHMHQGK